MKNLFCLALGLVLLAALSQGCAIGYDSLLFFTKTNVGVDVDSTPPTAEVSIARREGVIEPTFEGGKTPSVLSSFSSDSSGLWRGFSSDIGMAFATGDAAYAMAKLYDEDTPTDGQKVKDREYDSAILLDKEPKGGMLGDFLGLGTNLYGAGKMNPLLFGTDSCLGLKAAWSGQNAIYPSTVKFGFNRKEFAWAPVTIQEVSETERKILEEKIKKLKEKENKLRSEIKGFESGSTKEKDKSNELLDLLHQINELEKCNYRVKVPSLLATVDSSAQVAGNAKLTYLQYFATGKAALELAKKKAVRRAMLGKITPDLAPDADLGVSDKQLAARLLKKVKDLDPARDQDVEKINIIYQKAVDLEFLGNIEGFDGKSSRNKKEALIIAITEKVSELKDKEQAGRIRPLLEILEEN